MASGILGSANLASTTNTTIYTVPTSKITTCTVSFCNRTSGNVKIRLALSASNTPAAGEYIEYDSTVASNGVLERNGIVLDATKNILAYSDTSLVSVVVYGFEE